MMCVLILTSGITVQMDKTLILKEKSQSKKRTLIDIFQTRKFPVNISLTD